MNESGDTDVNVSLSHSKSLHHLKTTDNLVQMMKHCLEVHGRTAYFEFTRILRTTRQVRLKRDALSR